MKKYRKNIVFLTFLLVLFAWACSSSKTPQKIVTEPPPAQEQAPPEEEAPPIVQGKEEIKEETAQENQNQDKEAETAREDPGTLLEQALDSYQNAQAAWEKGDADAALQGLDESYSLVLKAQLSPDSPLLQEKNDLRLLIAQKIQQIYASRLTPVGDNHKTIPLEENKDVLEEIRSFQTIERKQFEEAYQRSGLYRNMILEELRKEGLPDELSWLPLIESSYKIKALSKARALGLWQFISSTGYRFGLKRDRWVDERMDPVKSTQAAVRYLTELHTFFGDWTTALAAYNCGEIRVQNVIRTQRVNYLDNFWDLYRQLPRETARFVPRFIAAALIISTPQKYGFSLPEPDPPIKFETLTVDYPFKLSAMATALGVDAAELTSLNPELRHDSTPAYEYCLRVPEGSAEKASLAVNNLPRWIPPEAQYTWHYVRKGETLSTIADRYHTTASAIARLNGLRSLHYIRPGQRLKIPGRGAAAASPAPKISPKPGEKTAYTVVEGDTLYSIARKFGMNLDDFLLLNGLAAEAKIYPGQVVQVLPKS